MSKWSVTNGIFSGMILCDKRSDLELKDLGVKVEVEEHWLPVCIDLREIALIRKSGVHGDEDERLTILESLQGGVSAEFTVDAQFEKLEPHFISSRTP